MTVIILAAHRIYELYYMSFMNLRSETFCHRFNSRVANDVSTFRPIKPNIYIPGAYTCVFLLVLYQCSPFYATTTRIFFCIFMSSQTLVMIFQFSYVTRFISMKCKINVSIITDWYKGITFDKFCTLAQCFR